MPRKFRAKDVPPHVNFLAGSISGITANFSLQPFDTVKTRLIGRGGVDGGGVPYKGMLPTFSRIVREEGFTALWKGGVATLIRVGAGAGLYFSAVEFLLPDRAHSKHGDGKILGAGIATRLAIAGLLNPVSVVKTRFESFSGPNPYRGVAHAMRTIAAKEGITALYAGLGTTIIKDAPYSGLYLLFYERIRVGLTALQTSAFGLDLDVTHAAIQFPSALLASSIAVTLTQPPDVLRTRLQLKKRALGQRVTIAETSREMWSEGGVRAFFRGLFPRLVKRSLSNAIVWTLFEQLVQQYRRVAGSSSS